MGWRRNALLTLGLATATAGIFAVTSDDEENVPRAGRTTRVSELDKDNDLSKVVNDTSKEGGIGGGLPPMFPKPGALNSKYTDYVDDIVNTRKLLEKYFSENSPYQKHLLDQLKGILVQHGYIAQEDQLDIDKMLELGIRVSGVDTKLKDQTLNEMIAWSEAVKQKYQITDGMDPEQKKKFEEIYQYLDNSLEKLKDYLEQNPFLYMPGLSDDFTRVINLDINDAQALKDMEVKNELAAAILKFREASLHIKDFEHGPGKLLLAEHFAKAIEGLGLTSRDEEGNLYWKVDDFGRLEAVWDFGSPQIRYRQGLPHTLSPLQMLVVGGTNNYGLMHQTLKELLGQLDVEVVELYRLNKAQQNGQDMLTGVKIGDQILSLKAFEGKNFHVLDDPNLGAVYILVDDDEGKRLVNVTEQFEKPFDYTVKGIKSDKVYANYFSNGSTATILDELILQGKERIPVGGVDFEDGEANIRLPGRNTMAYIFTSEPTRKGYVGDVPQVAHGVIGDSVNKFHNIDDSVITKADLENNGVDQWVSDEHVNFPLEDKKKYVLGTWNWRKKDKNGVRKGWWTEVMTSEAYRSGDKVILDVKGLPNRVWTIRKEDGTWVGTKVNYTPINSAQLEPLPSAK